jgi:hypothetical protein
MKRYTKIIALAALTAFGSLFVLPAPLRCQPQPVALRLGLRRLGRAGRRRVPVMRYFRRTILSAMVALACLVAVPTAAYACETSEVVEGSIWFVIAVGNSVLCVSGSLINCIAAGAMLIEGATAERCYAATDLGPADHRLV